MHKSNAGSFRLFLLLIGAIFLYSCSAKTQEPAPMPAAHLTDAYFPLLENRKVGIVVNQASRVGKAHLVDTLLKQKINLTRIYSPEHGFKGQMEDGALIDDGTYSAEKIPVISLYGKKRKPLPEDLEGIEIMVFDLQDVGVRFYTYISTLHYVMEACAEEEIPLIVLDRPNPNGHYIDGPVLEPEHRSFIGMHTVPVVYGLTIGEYARMINGEHWLADSIRCDLRVIKCRNYNHSAPYELSIPPSPNLQTMEAVYLYPSIAFFEGTIVTEGRGTDAPFQIIGHPDYSDKGFSFIPRSIEGASLNPKFKGRLCYGVDLRSIPADSIRSRSKLDLDLLVHFYRDLGVGKSFFTRYFSLLAGNDRLEEQILEELAAEQIRESWEEDLEGYKKIRAKYLLYPDPE